MESSSTNVKLLPLQVCLFRVLNWQQVNINKVHRRCIEEERKLMNGLTAELGNTE